MANVNLKTCTKGELKRSLYYVMDKANEDTHILLEDIYCDNPKLIYTCKRERKHSAFGTIKVMLEGTFIISYFEDKEGYREKSDKFIDDLYDYIVKEYR